MAKFTGMPLAKVPRHEQLFVLGLIAEHSAQHRNGVPEISIWSYVRDANKSRLTGGTLQSDPWQIVKALVADGLIAKQSEMYDAGFCVTILGREALNPLLAMRPKRTTQETPGVGTSQQPATSTTRPVGVDSLRMETPPAILEAAKVYMRNSKR